MNNKPRLSCSLLLCITIWGMWPQCGSNRVSGFVAQRAIVYEHELNKPIQCGCAYSRDKNSPSYSCEHLPNNDVNDNTRVDRSCRHRHTHWPVRTKPGSVANPSVRTTIRPNYIIYLFAWGTHKTGHTIPYAGSRPAQKHISRTRFSLFCGKSWIFILRPKDKSLDSCSAKSYREFMKTGRVM